MRRRSCVHGEHKGAKTPKSATRTLLPRAGKPVLHKVPLPSATATQFRSAAASHKIPDRQWRGAPAPVGFAPSRRGRGRRVSRSQVKVQTRRITGPVPRPRRCKRLRVGDMRRTFSNPALKNSLGSLGEAAIQSHAKRRRPANSSAACNRLPSSGARCLPANYGERADFSPCLWDALIRKVEGIEWAARDCEASQLRRAKSKRGHKDVASLHADRPNDHT